MYRFHLDHSHLRCSLSTPLGSPSHLPLQSGLEIRLLPAGCQETLPSVSFQEKLAASKEHLQTYQTFPVVSIGLSDARLQEQLILEAGSS